MDVVFAEAARIHVSGDALTDDGKINIAKAKPIARMGYYDYCVVDNVFKMNILGGDAAADGLQGKA